MTLRSFLTMVLRKIEWLKPLTFDPSTVSLSTSTELLIPKRNILPTKIPE